MDPDEESAVYDDEARSDSDGDTYKNIHNIDNYEHVTECKLYVDI